MNQQGADTVGTEPRTTPDTEPSDLWKLTYLTKAFSHRGRRKDFENYVIHAIWNRLADPEVKPVAQQVVRTGAQHFFLDLYFPQLGVAVEVDECHHDDQVEADRKRELRVVDALRSVDAEELTVLHVSEAASISVAALDEQIDAVVTLLKERAAQRRAAGTFEEWRGIRPDLTEYLAGRSSIDALDMLRDDVVFPYVVDIYNHLLGTSYQPMAGRSLRSYQDLSEIDPRYGEITHDGVRGLALSRATLNIRSLDPDQAPPSSTWQNSLSPDGTVLTEFLKPGKEPWAPGQVSTDLRAWFVKDEDNVRGKERWWRFAGLFHGRAVDAHRFEWTRFSTSMPLFRPDDPQV